MKKFFAAVLVAAFLFNSIGGYALSPAIPEASVTDKVVELRITKQSEVLDGFSDKKKLVPRKKVVLESSVCSGGFISEEGEIFTAKHCTEGAVDVTVLTANNRMYRGRVVYTSDIHDLSIIQIDKSDTPHFTFAKDISVGEDISILGSPLAITNTQTWGKIAKLEGDTMLLDCSVLPGNSGGVVFNSSGELVGIAVAGYIVGFGVTHLNIAQALDSVKATWKLYQKSLIKK